MDNMLTLEQLKEELAPYKNTLVLVGFDVRQLKDVVDEGDDFYWVLEDGYGKISYYSCVGGWEPLKGVISDRTYKLMCYQWQFGQNTELR